MGSPRRGDLGAEGPGPSCSGSVSIWLIMAASLCLALSRAFSLNIFLRSLKSASSGSLSESSSEAGWSSMSSLVEEFLGVGLVGSGSSSSSVSSSVENPWHGPESSSVA